jgi:hypothetical protein
MGLEDFLEPGPIANVNVHVLEILRDGLQPLKIPACVAGVSEKDLAHVVVDADDTTS